MGALRVSLPAQHSMIAQHCKVVEEELHEDPVLEVMEEDPVLDDERSSHRSCNKSSFAPSMRCGLDSVTGVCKPRTPHSKPGLQVSGLDVQTDDPIV